MSMISSAIWVELLKARRSRMPVLTALGFLLFPLVGGFFMIILRDPELARRIGLLGAKAQLTMGAADWPTYWGFLSLGTSVGGFLLFGLISSWVFGREYSDRTVKDLLALPTARSTIVLAKFVVIGLWAATLAVLVYVAGILAGLAVLGSPPTVESFSQGSAVFVVASLLTIILTAPIGFFASAGHGYLAPMAVMFLIVALAQVITIIGYGEYFPWAVPGVYVQEGQIAAISIAIVLLTSIAGIAGTLAWWELADQAH